MDARSPSLLPNFSIVMSALDRLDRLDAEDQLRSLVGAVTTARQQAGQPIDPQRITAVIREQLAERSSLRVLDPITTNKISGWGRPTIKIEWLRRQTRARFQKRLTSFTAWVGLGSTIVGFTLGIQAKTHYLALMQSGIPHADALLRWHASLGFGSCLILFPLGVLIMLVALYLGIKNLDGDFLTQATATEKERHAWRRVPRALAYQQAHPMGEVPLLLGDRDYLNRLVKEHLEQQAAQMLQNIQAP